jgi:hypothetical protein
MDEARSTALSSWSTLVPNNSSISPEKLAADTAVASRSFCPAAVRRCGLARAE